MKAKLKELKGHKIDLSKWTLDSVDEIKEKIGEALLAACTEVLEIATEEGCYAHISPTKEDCLSVNLMIPLASDFNDPVYKFSITELIDDYIENNVIGGTDNFHFGGEDVAKGKQIASELHKAADKILTFCKEPQGSINE